MGRVRKYRRVSTDEQAAVGFSLDAQGAKLAEFCERRGHVCVGDYVDDGYSAKTLRRPAMERLLREAEPGDIIVVYKLDRLTRSAKDLEFLLELSEKRNIYFQSATEDIETATPAGRLFVRLLIQFAQFERETIAERSAMGRKQRALSGYWSGSVAPFGYVLVDSDEVKRGRVLKRLAPDSKTAHLVPAIFERYLAGYGARTLAVWLNDELSVRSVHGKRFSAVTVTNILRNPVYVGESMIRRRKKNVVQRVPGRHEPLVEQHVYDAVQRMFEIRAKMPPRVATGEFPLAGIAVCGVCGGKLAGSNERVVRKKKRTDEKYRVYRCQNRVSGRGCGRPALNSISANITECAFAEAMEAIVTTNDDFDAFFAACQGEAANAVSTMDAEIERLKSELSDCQMAIAQWDAKFEKKRISEDEHEEKVAPHRERAHVIKARILEYETTKPTTVDKETMRVVFVSFRDSWDGLDAPARKALVQRLVAELPIRIVVHRGRRVEIRPLPLASSPSSSLQPPAGE